MNNSSIDDPLSADVQLAKDQAPSSPPPFARSGVLLAAACLLGWLVFCDAAFGLLTLWGSPSHRMAFLVFICGGSFFSQVGLLAAWNVWGPLAYWRRVAIGWGIATVLAAVWAVGRIVARLLGSGGMDLLDTFPLLFWPLVSMILEAPLWGLKILFGARIVRSSDLPDRSLAIADLLMGMVVAGIALALARLAHHLMDLDSKIDFWAGFAVISGIGASITLAVLSSLALATTRIKSGPATLIVTALLVLAIGLVPPTVAYLIAGTPSTGVIGVLGAFLIPASAAATIAAAFGIARLAGYRFQFGRSSNRQSSAAQEE